MIEANAISYHIKQKHLVKNVSFSIQSNELVVIMGANGAGKSTLLKIIAGAIPPSGGDLFFSGKKISHYSAAELSKKRAILSQHYHIAFPISVHDLVMMGRYPYIDTIDTKTNELIADQSMEIMQISNLRNRDYNTLSGGEAQKAQMSRVMAQITNEHDEEKLLLLDEPVSHLDIKHQHELLSVAKKLLNNKTAVIAVLHDINLAIKYADRIFFMKQGELIHAVTKKEPVTASILKDIFDIDATILDLPNTEHKWVSF
jgi:iron complex transport system ATP-binding protein